VRGGGFASDPQASIKAWLVRGIKTELIELHTPFSCSTKSAEAPISCVPQRLVVEGTFLTSDLQNER
jgi:hypothetical protein